MTKPRNLIACCVLAPRNEPQAASDKKREDSASGAEGSNAGGPTGSALPLSASPLGNYYIYSFDGKLLQVYDVYGTLLKDYIYMGDRLMAEYDHVGSRLLYYTQDQINSTRVVTDPTGNVVYWAVHNPYGEIQVAGQNNTYDTQLKFSGKERDAESELDYFGARYYDRSQYRFISADPKLIRQAAQAESERWNLYSFCINNPINNIDPSGKWTSKVHFDWTLKIAIMAGIPEGVARTIAGANDFIDKSLKTTSFPAIERQRQAWHFVSIDRFFEAIGICRTTWDPKEFGRYLHVIQD